MPVIIPETPDKPDPNHVLTWRQRKVLQVIRESVQQRGYPPSMREIGEAVGLTSTSSVSYQLSTLQKKGYLHRDVGRPRGRSRCGCPVTRRCGQARPGTEREAEEAGDIPGIDIPSQEAAYVPLVGRIAAGGPILAEQGGNRRRVPAAQATGRRGHPVPAQGRRRLDDQRRHRGRGLGGRPEQPVAENGEIVAAMLDGEATVKTFKQSRRARLADSAPPGLYADPR